MKTKLTLAAMLAVLTTSAAFLPCLRPGIMSPVNPVNPGATAHAYAGFYSQGAGAIKLYVNGNSFVPYTWRTMSMYRVGGVYFPMSDTVRTNSTAIALEEIVFPCMPDASEVFVTIMCTDPATGVLLAVNEAFIKKP